MSTRKVIDRNGFVLVRSNKHETWVRHDDEGRVVGHTSVSHGNAQIRDQRLFKELLRQANKTEEHFYEVLKSKSKGAGPDDHGPDRTGDPAA